MSLRDEGIAVRIENLEKHYSLGELLSIRSMMTPGARADLKRSRDLAALRQVTFDIGRGESFAILGRNGSGKSTLLQILCGIAMPTSGRIKVWGRILPLLAVGTGFHAELTGRENVVLFGTILGLPRRSVLDHVDEIFAFAELHRHADTPVKRYSDGMLARLSFALGMIFPADIYIFDEVLAVVDDDFRRRCTDAMQRLVADGKTVIFVSHDLDQVRLLCRRAALLAHGRLVAVGDVTEVTSVYAADAHQDDS